MGILSRCADILAANINDMLDKCEDPGKMVDQCLRKAKEDLAAVKTETAGVMANEKRCKREWESVKAKYDELEVLATRALEAGNEDDARTALQEQEKVGVRLEEAKKIYDMAKSDADKMQRMHDKLVADIQNLEARRNGIKSVAAMAKAQATINKTAARAEGASGSIAAFDRFASRAQEALDRAQAEAELNEGPKDEAADLRAKYGAGGTASASVDAKLAALKAKMGK